MASAQLQEAQRHVGLHVDRLLRPAEGAPEAHGTRDGSHLAPRHNARWSLGLHRSPSRRPRTASCGQMATPQGDHGTRTEAKRSRGHVAIPGCARWLLGFSAWMACCGPASHATPVFLALLTSLAIGGCRGSFFGPTLRDRPSETVLRLV